MTPLFSGEDLTCTVLWFYGTVSKQIPQNNMHGDPGRFEIQFHSTAPVLTEISAPYSNLQVVLKRPKHTINIFVDHFTNLTA